MAKIESMQRLTQQLVADVEGGKNWFTALSDALEKKLLGLADDLETRLERLVAEESCRATSESSYLRVLLDQERVDREQDLQRVEARVALVLGDTHGMEGQLGTNLTADMGRLDAYVNEQLESMFKNVQHLQASLDSQIALFLSEISETERRRSADQQNVEKLCAQMQRVEAQAELARGDSHGMEASTVDIRALDAYVKEQLESMFKNVQHLEASLDSQMPLLLAEISEAERRRSADQQNVEKLCAQMQRVEAQAELARCDSNSMEASTADIRALDAYVKEQLESMFKNVQHLEASLDTQMPLFLAEIKEAERRRSADQQNVEQLCAQMQRVEVQAELARGDSYGMEASTADMRALDAYVKEQLDQMFKNVEHLEASLDSQMPLLLAEISDAERRRGADRQEVVDELRELRQALSLSDGEQGEPPSAVELGHQLRRFALVLEDARTDLCAQLAEERSERTFSHNAIRDTFERFAQSVSDKLAQAGSDALQNQVELLSGVEKLCAQVREERQHEIVSGAGAWQKHLAKAQTDQKLQSGVLAERLAQLEARFGKTDSTVASLDEGIRESLATWSVPGRLDALDDGMRTLNSRLDQDLGISTPQADAGSHRSASLASHPSASPIASPRSISCELSERLRGDFAHLRGVISNQEATITNHRSLGGSFSIPSSPFKAPPRSTQDSSSRPDETRMRPVLAPSYTASALRSTSFCG